MVCEISQSQKDRYCMIPHIWSTYSSQNHRDRNYNGGCQGPEKGRNVLFYGCRVSVLQNKNILEMDGNDRVVQQCKRT